MYANLEFMGFHHALVSIVMGWLFSRMSVTLTKDHQQRYIERDLIRLDNIFKYTTKLLGKEACKDN